MKAADRFIAKIDSSSTMLLAVANYLRGKDISGLGFVPAARVLGVIANLPPKPLRQYVYIYGGRKESRPPKEILHLRAEQISRWVVEKYPPGRKYPAVMIGSSNGALVHLCAALGIPWLPQTVLVPVRRSRKISPDDLIPDAEAFRKPVRAWLEKNPQLQVNQMHDPVQDRLMIQQMGYFRVKLLELGETYEKFLRQSLLPGGTVLVSECTYPWQMTALGPRHFFQVGGYGGLSDREYLEGSPRIDVFLRRERAKRKRWEAPRADTTRPEAEWGFEPSLLSGLRQMAKREGWRLRRISYRDPAAPSSLIADLYRRWYERRGLPTTRIFAESFLLMDPWWTLRTGSIPFWMVFNTGRSAKELRKYIREKGPFDEIYLALFANSIQGIDQTSIEDWKTILRKAKRGKFIGVHETSYPYDLGVYFRFHVDLQRMMAERLPMPKPMELAKAERFILKEGEQYGVHWLD